ncbi:MAG TPA: ABC transporter permease [Acidimicrobiales bacterium]|nr:ABC transporter permease [Acidimicrobiales bacterium]
MSAIAEPVSGATAALEITDISAVPDSPPAELFYSHRPHLLRSARAAWERRDVMYTLAERDIRAQYKQAVLGLSWSVFTPLLSLVIFTILFHHVSSLQLKIPGTDRDVPYALATFTGMWGWSFFSGAINGGSNSLLANKVLMMKTHFPRECFPVSQILESAFTSTIAIAPFIVLMGIFTYAPKMATLWVPLYIMVEIPFILGVVLLVSAVIVQARDLQQVMGIMVQFAMFASPIIWQFPELRHIHIPGIPGIHNFQIAYSAINPLGPVLGAMKGSILLGQGPPWELLGIATCSSLFYLVIGYTVFKRLEVNFADLT